MQNEVHAYLALKKTKNKNKKKTMASEVIVATYVRNSFDFLSYSQVIR